MQTNNNGLQDFYYAFRNICRPPMVKVAEIDIGDLWFYDGLALSAICCLGKKNLLVAYDINGPKEQAINLFREAHNRLGDENYKRPMGMFLVFAAREREDGTLNVSFFNPGDWSGLPYYKYALPETKLTHPPGWE